MTHQVQNDGHITEEAAAMMICCKDQVIRGSNSITEALRITHSFGMWPHYKETDINARNKF